MDSKYQNANMKKKKMFKKLIFCYIGSENSSGKILSSVMSASKFSLEDREYLSKGK